MQERVNETVLDPHLKYGYLIAAMAGAILTLGGVLFALEHQPQPTTQQLISQYVADSQKAGATTPIAGQSYNLSGAGISNTDTSITLTSFTIKQTGQPIVAANVGSPFYITLEPGSNTTQEIASCTGITQNSNLTATFTGCTRGLEPISPYVASTTLAFGHGGGSTVILSDPPQLFNLYGALANAQTWSGTNTFGSTTPPVYDADPIWANFSTQAFADISYVNSVVTAGAPNASESVKGIVQLASATQAALGTLLGSTGARLALGSNLATSTPGNSTVTGDIPTLTNSIISPYFIATSSAG